MQGSPSMVKGVGFRSLSFRGSWVQIPPPAPLRLKWKSMNKKMKLLAIGIAIMIVSGTAAVFIQTVENKKTPPLPIRVACVGDSIPRGSGYTVKLQSLLGTHYSVVNSGVDGSTVSLNSKRPYIRQPEFQKAEEFQPDIVVIMLGTNDANPKPYSI